MAGDAVQDTWLEIVRKSDQWDATRGSFASWIYAIHYHCLVRLAQKSPPGDKRDPLDAAPEAQATNADPDRRLMACQALEALSEELSPDSAALLMAYYLVANPRLGLIAASLGISNAALRKRIERIKKEAQCNSRLRDLLEALGIGGSGTEGLDE